MSRCLFRERKVAPKVKDGTLVVHEDGRILRVKVWHRERHHGKLRPKECPPRDATRPFGGYRGIRIVVTRGRLVSCLAHRLLWHVLRGPIPRGLEVNHKDGNKLNNRLDNLELLTTSENCRHALRTGLIIPKKGSETSQAKLTEDQVLRLRRLVVTDGIRQQEAATMFGVSFQTVHLVVHGKRWKHVGGPLLDHDARAEHLRKWPKDPVTGRGIKVNV